MLLEQEQVARPFRIAIDGPSAAGKSVIGQALAKRLNYLYFDTGAMYRAVTLLALRKGVDLDDAAGLSLLAETHRVDIQRPSVNDGRQYTVMVEGEDVTWAIRQPDVDASVSPVSAVPGVRRALVVQQREIGAKGRVVMVGRDIGTVVMPDAELKVFLVASPEERARRRYREIIARGQEADFQAILAAMIKRDRIDRERADSPAIPAADAVVIDTDGLSIGGVQKKVLALVDVPR